ncbi:DUF4183 domain-containing protein [Guptibacillus hwajinpoensis]|uniref:DUF4183 domain-containing protein n=1 Tax=Guptibacillus hwajinpoensis TaxID=208199 RepID=UPI001CFC86F8|nr:DUF4183 domain-containing protein [Pseudalkalibacillus hwajinpoensis]WLR59844.1 DUF4183 domain-containing protein [Pseudalkalibacillus hwajinpoensis]
MINKRRSDRYNNPKIMLPTINSKTFRAKLPTKVRVYEYFSIANGNQKTFTDKDAVKGYENHKILSCKDVSFMNLFINAVLQPEMNYKVDEGVLILLTEDAPIEGVTIILQMIKV